MMAVRIIPSVDLCHGASLQGKAALNAEAFLWKREQKIKKLSAPIRNAALLKISRPMKNRLVIKLSY